MSSSLTIGITGGIGAGKSVVSRILRCNGFMVYDCDFKAKYLMCHNRNVKEELIRFFGDGIYNANGQLEKQKLAHLIFNDERAKNQVNSIVHKAVRIDIEREKNDYPDLFFIESAILATSHLDKLCTCIWIVDASSEVRVKRVTLRDKLNLSQIQKRMDIQKDELDRLKGDCIVILNNDGEAPLLSKVLKMTDKYINQQTYILSC